LPRPGASHFFQKFPFFSSPFLGLPPYGMDRLKHPSVRGFGLHQTGFSDLFAVRLPRGSTPLPPTISWSADQWPPPRSFFLVHFYKTETPTAAAPEVVPLVLPHKMRATSLSFSLPSLFLLYSSLIRFLAARLSPYQECWRPRYGKFFLRSENTNFWSH